MPLFIAAQSILRWLLVIVLAVMITGTFADVAVHNGVERPKSVLRLFNLDEEANLPTWLSSSLLLLSSLLLWGISRSAGEYGRRWGYLAVVFAALSLDETASIHELLIVPLREQLHLTGALHFGWVLVGIPAVVLIAVLYYRPVAKLPSRIKYLAGLAALAYVGGALGLEMVGGAYADRYGEQTLIYGALTSAEENCELAGLYIWIYALMSYLVLLRTQLRFADSGSPPPTAG